jgi:uncharacterized protein DUF6970
LSRSLLIAAFFSIAIVILAGCKEPTPQFVVELIALDKSKALDAPDEIWRYRLKGETVYYVPPKCCDIPSTLYDQDGAAICSPDGGLTPDGDGRCPTFFKDRRRGVLVWKRTWEKEKT